MPVALSHGMEPHTPTPATSRLALGTAAVTAAALGYLVLARRATRPDGRVDLEARTLAAHLPPVLGTIGSAAGHPAIQQGLAWLTFAWLSRRGVDDARRVPAAALGTWASYRLTKLFVHRERPGGDGDKPSGASYPSGHTASTTAVALTAACVLARNGQVPARSVAPLAVGIPLLVAAARVIHDEHWATDALGGLLLGAVGASIALLWPRLAGGMPTISDVALAEHNERYAG